MMFYTNGRDASAGFRMGRWPRIQEARGNPELVDGVDDKQQNSRTPEMDHHGRGRIGKGVMAELQDDEQLGQNARYAQPRLRADAVAIAMQGHCLLLHSHRHSAAAYGS